MNGIEFRPDRVGIAVERQAHVGWPWPEQHEHQEVEVAALAPA